MRLARHRPNLTTGRDGELTNASLPPAPWNLRTIQIIKCTWEEVGEGLGQAGVAAFGLGADGVEVHEPRLEERPRHRLQRLVHPPVQLDLVVQRAEDVGDGALFVERRQRESEVALSSGCTMTRPMSALARIASRTAASDCESG